MALTALQPGAWLPESSEPVWTRHPSRALRLLMREGRNQSEAVRDALVEAGRRRVQRSALAEEVRRLAADPHYSQERRAVMADMDAISPDWPV